MAARPGSCWPKTAAATPEHLHVQFHNRIKAVVLERRDGSVGQVYTGAYTEGIEVYFLTLLRLTCGTVQMCLCKETLSGKVGGGKWHQAMRMHRVMGCAGRWDALGDALGDVLGNGMCWALRWPRHGGEQPLAGWGMGAGCPSPRGGSPRSGLAVNLL